MTADNLPPPERRLPVIKSRAATAGDPTRCRLGKSASLVRLGLLAAAPLAPLRASADVRVDPGDIALSFGLVWLLFGAGLLAIWAALATVRRLLRGATGPVLRPKVIRVVAVAVAVCWVLSVGVFLLAEGRSRRGRGTPLQATALGDIRTMIAGQAAYETANGGFFEGDPTCLAEPARCIPGYAQDAPTFLDRSLASAEVNKGGYRRVFHAGPPAGPDAIQTKRSSRSSVRSYAYTAVPQAPGPDRPGYCGDASGVVCATRDGSPPRVVDGACVVAQSEEGRGLTDTSPPKGCRVLGD